MRKEAPLSPNLVFYGSDADFLKFSDLVAASFGDIQGYLPEKKELDGQEYPYWQIQKWRMLYRGIPGKREMEILATFFSSENLASLPEREPEADTGLRLFIGRHCPHCPGVLRKVLPLLSWKKIRLEIIDAETCPEMAEQHSVRAVPTLMIAGDEKNFRWVGDVAFQDLLSALLGRKVHELGEESLRNILESGDAERLCAMMRERGEIFPSFYPLLTHEKWPVRLGAMVVAETLVQEKKGLGDALLETLWHGREELDPVVLGDMIYLMGSGRPEIWIPRLESFFPGVEEGELKDAVEEALQSLKG